MDTTDDTPERNIGQEICDALGLDAKNLISMSLEPAGHGDLIVTTTSQVFLSDWDDEGRARAGGFVERIRQYRLVPLTDDTTRPVHPVTS